MQFDLKKMMSLLVSTLVSYFSSFSSVLCFFSHGPHRQFISQVQVIQNSFLDLVIVSISVYMHDFCSAQIQLLAQQISIPKSNFLNPKKCVAAANPKIISKSLSMFIAHPSLWDRSLLPCAKFQYKWLRAFEEVLCVSDDRDFPTTSEFLDLVIQQICWTQETCYSFLCTL